MPTGIRTGGSRRTGARRRDGHVNGKAVMVGVIVLSLALWGALMFSLASGSSDDGSNQDCIALENC